MTGLQSFIGTWMLFTALATCNGIPARHGIKGRQSAAISPRPRSYSIGFLLFPGWEPLDVFGPLEILYSMSSEKEHKMTLAIIADAIGPVRAIPPPMIMVPGSPPESHGYMIGPTIYATHTYETAPALDILLVPGGAGIDIYHQNNNTALEDFVASRYPQLDYLLSVCTGASALAKSGVLDGKRATTNKAAWDSVVVFGKNITWVPSARWTTDGNIWTSSGVAAGMDMTYAFLNHLYGNESTLRTMNGIEYAPHTNPDWDPFSVVHNVPGADRNMSMLDCVGPVGLGS